MLVKIEINDIIHMTNLRNIFPGIDFNVIIIVIIIIIIIITIIIIIIIIITIIIVIIIIGKVIHGQSDGDEFRYKVCLFLFIILKNDEVGTFWLSLFLCYKMFP